MLALRRQPPLHLKVDGDDEYLPLPQFFHTLLNSPLESDRTSDPGLHRQFHFLYLFWRYSRQCCQMGDRHVASNSPCVPFLWELHQLSQTLLGHTTNVGDQPSDPL